MLPAVLENISGAAAGADLRDQRQDYVFGGHAGSELALDADLAGLRTVLQQALGGEHMFHLAGADAEGERTKRAMSGGVAVSANDGHIRAG